MSTSGNADIVCKAQFGRDAALALLIGPWRPLA
jgi:hypothetical protein